MNLSRKECTDTALRGNELKAISMKKRVTILLLLALTLGLNHVNAQVSISCTYREYCEWDDQIKEFESDCKGYEDVSLFVMNETETLFTHTTETIKSTYFVKEKEYDDVNEVFAYTVTSDVGNEYYYIFDLKHKEVRAVFVNDEGKTMLLRFLVKAIF